MGSTVVVQCPTCQSKFRIADDKVTDRGVRVRCTSCKNVFQVRKPGAAAAADALGPGQTMDLSTLSAKQVGKAKNAAPRAGTPAGASRPGTGPVRPGGASKPSTGPVQPAPSRPSTGPVRANPSRPATGPLRATSNPAASAAQKLETADLFGMDELTGDAPLSDPRPSRPAAKPMPDFDALELDTDPAPPAAANEPAGPRRSAAASAAEESLELADVNAGKSGSLLGPEQAGSRPPTPRPPAKKQPTGPIAVAPPLSESEHGPARALVSSALTGLLGAILAIGVLVISAFSDDSAASWLGRAPSSDVVATRVVSGLYDTASGKPVFFVRGRIENHGKRVRGPVRVTAELISEGAAEAKGEALAGAEPNAEDVYSLRSADDAAKLSRTLDAAKVKRKLQPGESVPFFAVIADPPGDLVHHRLHLKVESVDAWNPPSPPQAAKGK